VGSCPGKIEACRAGTGRRIGSIRQLRCLRAALTRYLSVPRVAAKFLLINSLLDARRLKD